MSLIFEVLDTSGVNLIRNLDGAGGYEAIWFTGRRAIVALIQVNEILAIISCY